MSPGFKFNEWEMKGVPLRIEIGLRDINDNAITIVRRDTSKKTIVDRQDSLKQFSDILHDIQNTLFNQALKFQNDNTVNVNNYSDFKLHIEKGAFISTYWDGNPKTESEIKSETNATIRCILDDQDLQNKKCVFSSQPAKYKVIFAKAY